MERTSLRHVSPANAEAFFVNSSVRQCCNGSESPPFDPCFLRGASRIRALLRRCKTQSRDCTLSTHASTSHLRPDPNPSINSIPKTETETESLAGGVDELCSKAPRRDTRFDLPFEGQKRTSTPRQGNVRGKSCPKCFVTSSPSLSNFSSSASCSICHSKEDLPSCGDAAALRAELRRHLKEQASLLRQLERRRRLTKKLLERRFSLELCREDGKASSPLASSVSVSPPSFPTRTAAHLRRSLPQSPPHLTRVEETAKKRNTSRNERNCQTTAPSATETARSGFASPIARICRSETRHGAASLLAPGASWRGDAVSRGSEEETQKGNREEPPDCKEKEEKGEKGEKEDPLASDAALACLSAREVGAADGLDEAMRLCKQLFRILVAETKASQSQPLILPPSLPRCPRSLQGAKSIARKESFERGSHVFKIVQDEKHSSPPFAATSPSHCRGRTHGNAVFLSSSVSTVPAASMSLFKARRISIGEPAPPDPLPPARVAAPLTRRISGKTKSLQEGRHASEIRLSRDIKGAPTSQSTAPTLVERKESPFLKIQIDRPLARFSSFQPQPLERGTPPCFLKSANAMAPRALLTFQKKKQDAQVHPERNSSSDSLEDGRCRLATLRAFEDFEQREGQRERKEKREESVSSSSSAKWDRTTQTWRKDASFSKSKRDKREHVRPSRVQRRLPSSDFCSSTDSEAETVVPTESNSCIAPRRHPGQSSCLFQTQKAPLASPPIQSPSKHSAFTGRSTRPSSKNAKDVVLRRLPRDAPRRTRSKERAAVQRSQREADFEVFDSRFERRLSQHARKAARAFIDELDE